MRTLFLLICCSLYEAAYAQALQTEILNTNTAFIHQIEIFVEEPQSESFPLLVFLHGASSDRGIQSLSKEWIDHWVEKGYAVAAVSLPGFGQTTGRKDFCGPFTLDCLHYALDAIKEELNVPDFGIVGFGQGSLAALLLATERPDIRCVVSSNGVYDLLSHLSEEDRLYKTLIAKNYAIAFNKHEFKIRSPIQRVNDLSCNVFLVHRKENPIIPEQEVIRFFEAMKASGKPCEMTLLPKSSDKQDAGKISYEELPNVTEKWIDAQMLSIYK